MWSQVEMLKALKLVARTWRKSCRHSQECVFFGATSPVAYSIHAVSLKHQALVVRVPRLTEKHFWRQRRFVSYNSEVHRARACFSSPHEQVSVIHDSVLRIQLRNRGHLWVLWFLCLRRSLWRFFLFPTVFLSVAASGFFLRQRNCSPDIRQLVLIL